ncbi:ileal sodium/bile acid cotransporter-like [Diadema antillarum]|uniref:ileal sodium/bile acid cotransporter-like n=1 Tax=Diadema antillarum TaxID=105358 RepID=UPI003A83C639
MTTRLSFTIVTIFLVVIALLPTTTRGQCDSDGLVNITYFEDTVYVFEGEEINVTILVNDVKTDGRLSFSAQNDGYFEVVVDRDYQVETSDDFEPFNITVPLLGKAISISDLLIEFRTTPDVSTPLLVGAQTIGVKRVPVILQTIYIYVLMAWVVLSYLSMGGSMDVPAIWQRVRRPWGVIIGIFSQFIVMPAMTYFIARLLPGDDASIAIGIVLVGTCPGGWLSNIFSVLLDVDFILSVTMTFFSSIIALGMMPLNLFIYSTPFTDENSRLSTPYQDLAIQLILLIIPCFLGIGISYKYPKFKDYSGKGMKPISALLIIVAISLAVPADLYAFTTSPVEIWVIAIVTPTLGAFFGLSLARIFGRDIRTSITISLETGIQNALLGRTIVGLYYPQPEADLISRVTLVTVLVTLIEGTVASLVYYVVRYFLCRSRCDSILGVEAPEDEEKLSVVEMGQKYLSTADVSNNNGHIDNGLDNPALEMTSESTDGRVNAVSAE